MTSEIIEIPWRIEIFLENNIKSTKNQTFIFSFTLSFSFKSFVFVVGNPLPNSPVGKSAPYSILTDASGMESIRQNSCSTSSYVIS
jgi:hypothetical protein